MRETPPKEQQELELRRINAARQGLRKAWFKWRKGVPGFIKGQVSNEEMARIAEDILPIMVREGLYDFEQRVMDDLSKEEFNSPGFQQHLARLRKGMGEEAKSLCLEAIDEKRH